MATTRPKQAIGPDHPQSTRDPSGSPEGASAPSGVPGGENAMEQPKNSTPNGTKAAAPAVETAPAKKTSPRAAKPVTSEPAVIVFGRSVYGIPQAAWFPANEADLATRAARLMGLQVLTIEDETHQALAARLRPGQVYASGSDLRSGCRQGCVRQALRTGRTGRGRVCPGRRIRECGLCHPACELGGDHVQQHRSGQRGAWRGLVGGDRDRGQGRSVDPTLARLRPGGELHSHSVRVGLAAPSRLT